MTVVVIALNVDEETARGQGAGARRFMDASESRAYRREAACIAHSMALRAYAREGPRGREIARSWGEERGDLSAICVESLLSLPGRQASRICSGLPRR